MKYVLFDSDGRGDGYCRRMNIVPEYRAETDFEGFITWCRENRPEHCVLSGVGRETGKLATFLRKTSAQVTIVNPDGSYSSDKIFLASFLESLPVHGESEGAGRKIYGYRRNKEGSLEINPEEAGVIRDIFMLYTEEKKSTLTIAGELNRQGKLTGRGKSWNQVAVSRILSQPLYRGEGPFGRIDPAYAIVSGELYEKAQECLQDKGRNFRGRRPDESYVFSGLIRCKCCGSIFRRLSRHYKNDYVRWVCMERNMKGKEACPNRIAVDEEELLTAVRQYFEALLASRASVEKMILTEYRRSHGEEITDAERILNQTFREMQETVDAAVPSNRVLSSLLDKICIDPDGTVDIDLAIFSKIGVDSKILSGR